MMSIVFSKQPQHHSIGLLLLIIVVLKNYLKHLLLAKKYRIDSRKSDSLIKDNKKLHYLMFELFECP